MDSSLTHTKLEQRALSFIKKYNNNIPDEAIEEFENLICDISIEAKRESQEITDMFTEKGD